MDVNDPAFLAPKCMKEAFDHCFAADACPRTEQDYFNCAFLSLAESYRVAISELEENLNRKFHELYIVGGGAKNEYLNQLTEKACGLKVVALPIEATAIGNLKIQEEL